LGGDGEKAAGGTGGKGKPGGYGTEFHTIDGSSYGITIKTSRKELGEKSKGGCLPAPKDGRTNLGFEVRVDNLSDKDAPMPDVTFAITATPAGQLDQSPEALAGNNHDLEITPRAKGEDCDSAYAIHPAGRGKLGKGESATFTGTVPNIVSPVPD